jgi:hypothetical protein
MPTHADDLLPKSAHDFAFFCLFGCGVNSPELFPRGTKVRIELSYANHYLVADARVAYASTKSGMGVAFIGVEPEDERTLDIWIVELRSSN